MLRPITLEKFGPTNMTENRLIMRLHEPSIAITILFAKPDGHIYVDDLAEPVAESHNLERIGDWQRIGTPAVFRKTLRGSRVVVNKGYGNVKHYFDTTDLELEHTPEATTNLERIPDNVPLRTPARGASPASP